MMRSPLSTSVLVVLGLLLGGCQDKPEPGQSTPVEGGGDTDTPSTEAVLWAVVGTHPASALMSITGRSADDVWAVGAADADGGLILHWDGAAWSRIESGDAHDLWWVQVHDDGGVVAVGAGGTVLRGDVGGFVRQETPGLGAQTLYGTWGTAADDQWAVGGFAGRWGFVWHWDGVAWQEVALPDDMPLSDEGELPALFKVWGRSADDVWIVGGEGTVLHWDGAALSRVDSGTDALLFTVHGNDEQIVIVGPQTVLLGGEADLTEEAPVGVGLLQGACFGPAGELVVSGQSGTLWIRDPAGTWEQQLNATGVSPESLHAAWVDPDGGRWAVGGGVLSAALDQGVIFHEGELAAHWEAPPDPDPVPVTCAAEDVDPVPGGSIARRWNEQILNAIRRDIPRPGVHARNLFHTSVAMWDAWAVYDDVADPYLDTPRVEVADPADRQAAREAAMAMAAYRVAVHRYHDQVGGELSEACFDAFMDTLGLDPADTHTDGDDPVAVGNRIGEAVVARYADDGANEAGSYADTTGWSPVNDPLVVDAPGVELVDPDAFQLLNLAAAETQNGIVLDSGLQTYIGAQWGLVTAFALGEDRDGTWMVIDPGGDFPAVTDPAAKDWVLDVVRKHARLDATLPETIDISPGAYGNNALGQNDGVGHALNPVTGAPYAPNVVPTGDFARVLAEFWADGPKSETPPGHWNTLANTVSDALAPEDLVVAEIGEPLDRLAWDVHLYFVLNGALHDAAITAWGAKRESLGARPISWIRWMAEHGQSSDPKLPSYDPDGLPLEDGVIELISAESSAPGERHHHLRWFIGEVAVRSWRGEPGDRENVASGVAWMRAREWFPYQRRTFVTPAFPGYVSGHSTFSRVGAEVLTRMTGSPWFPGGLGEYVAPQGTYLVFEDGPSVEVRLQWGTYQDAADQAGQSRLWGGIHLWPDDTYGRQLGDLVGNLAMDEALIWFDGSARADK